jgi:hypothetical protein
VGERLPAAIARAGDGGRQGRRGGHGGEGGAAGVGDASVQLLTGLGPGSTMSLGIRSVDDSELEASDEHPGAH